MGRMKPIWAKVVVNSQYYNEVIRLLDIGRKYKLEVLDYSLSAQTLLPKVRFLLKKKGQM